MRTEKPSEWRPESGPEAAGRSGIGKQLDGAVDVGPVDPPGPGDDAVGSDSVVTGAREPIIGGRGDRLPRHVEPIAGADGPTLENPASDDQLESVDIRIGGVGDDGGSAELAAGGIDAVGGVGAGDAAGAATSRVGLGREVTGQGAHVEHHPESHETGDPLHAAHPPDPSDELVIPRWLKGVAALFLLATLAAIAFAYFEPVQVLPRLRVGPGYALTDSGGRTYSSESGRGSVTVYSFTPVDCGNQLDRCDAINQTMADITEQVGNSSDLDEVTVRLVTVALGTSTPDELAEAESSSGADGVTWRWIGGPESDVRRVVGDGFRRYYETGDDGTIDFDPGFVVVDGAGIVRGEYRYQTLADDADKITSHLEILADEIRYAKGATAVAYEAAHLFLCYP